MFARLIFFIAQIFTTVAFANVLGPMQTFSPTPDSLVFENIHSSRTLPENTFNLGLFSAYVKNQLSTYEDLSTQSFIHYRDAAWTYDFVVAYGLTDSFQLFYSLPGFLSQDPDGDQFSQNGLSQGTSSHRPGFKYSFYDHANGGGLAFIGSIDFPTSQNDPYTGLDPQPIFNAELAYDIFRDTQRAYGFNLGYRARRPGAVPPTADYFYPLRDQLNFSAGYVTGLDTDRRYHFELNGVLPIDKRPHNQLKHVSALEGLIAYRQQIRPDLWGHVGGTVELLPQGLAPDYRLYAGVHWTFGGARQLKVVPEAIYLQPKHSQQVQVSGGQTPYQFKLANSNGTFDQSTLVYAASAKSKSTNELIVSDAKGTQKIVPIEVEKVSPLVATPKLIELTEGAESVPIKVEGGKSPYRYELANQFGEFNNQSMTYLAPASAGQDQLRIYDSFGQTASISIRVMSLAKPSREVVINDLQFDFDSDRLTPDSKARLMKNLESLKDQDVKKIVVAGHTDSLGSDDYNLRLSRKRAQAIAKQMGTRFDIEAIGYGETKPVDTNETEAGRQNNRRVELKIYQNN